MDVDIDALAAELAPRRMGCKIGSFIKHTGDQGQAIRKYLDDPSYPQAAMVALLGKLGLKVGIKLLGQHRNGQCACHG